MTYTFFSHVAFGDNWSATQHNNLLDNGDFNLALGSRVFLSPQSSIPPMSGVTAAGIEIVESSGAGTQKPMIYELLYVTGANNARAWIFKLKYTYTAPKVRIAHRWSTSVGSKQVKWDCYIAAVSATDVSMSAKVFTTVNSQTDAANAVADTQAESIITLTNLDSMAQDDWVCLYLQRDVSVANNHTGTAKVSMVEFIYG